MRFPWQPRIRADLRRVRLHLASAKMGGAAARWIGLDDLGRVAGNHRPRRTRARSRLGHGRQPTGWHLPELPEVRRRSLHPARIAR